MIKKIFLIFVLAFVSLSFSLNQALAQITDNPMTGLNESAEKVAAYDNDRANPSDNFLATKVGQIISVALSFVGVLFFILMIYAGILWMTASGNEQQISKAKGLLINAIIGIIVVFSAYALTAFLGNNLLQ
ncbi:MAG: hypothetical protein WC719_02355 [Patescibacteria group bacterium]|jgi:hypothetical protein